MKALFAINALGVVIATVYAGMAASSVWIPWYAFGAAAAFVIALAIPMVAEYRSMGRDFGAIESDFMTHGRGDMGQPQPRQQVFGANDKLPGFKGSSPPTFWIIVFGVIGLGLLVADVIQWLPLPTAPEDDRSLSNF